MKSLTLNTEAKEVLMQLSCSIQDLTMDEYVEKIPLLGDASIGEHTRHIIELFQQLSFGYENGIINYDGRKRDYRLQNNIDIASECIADIIANLCKEDKTLRILSLYNNQESYIESNYARELMYNIEHCIHHQAIIKIALLIIDKNNVDENYGVAKSTIVNRNQCAQ